MDAFYKSSPSSLPTHLFEEVTEEALLRNLSLPTFLSTPSVQYVQPPNNTIPRNLPLTSFGATPFSQNVQPIDETIPRNLSLPSFIPTPVFQNVQLTPPTQIPNPNPINFNGNNVANSINFNGNNVQSSNPRRNISPRTRTTILNIAPGIDIIQTLIQFACVRALYVSVIAGFGLLSDLDLRYPEPQYPPLKLSGNFQMLTFSGIYNGCASSSSAPSICPNCFIVSVGSAEGEVMGGIVATSMISSSSVVLVTSTCDTPPPPPF